MGISRRIIVSAGLLALVTLGFALWPTGEPSDTADPNDVAQVALGQNVYAMQCASCHGSKLEGQLNWRTRKADGKLPAPPHDASGHTWHHPDPDLFQIIKHGTAALAPPGYQSDMLAFAERLSDTDIWAVLAYIKSTWPEEIRLRRADIAERARKEGGSR